MNFNRLICYYWNNLIAICCVESPFLYLIIMYSNMTILTIVFFLSLQGFLFYIWMNKDHYTCKLCVTTFIGVLTHDNYLGTLTIDNEKWNHSITQDFFQTRFAINSGKTLCNLVQSFLELRRDGRYYIK